MIKIKASVGFFGRMFGRSKEIEAPVVTQAIVDKHLHFFVTDGEASDQNQAKALLERLTSENQNAYFVFISVYRSEIRFLRTTFGDTGYSDYINFTPSELKNLQNASDEDLYDLLLTPSFIDWMNR